MLSLILFVFGFLAGFLFCAWMMGQYKSIKKTNIIDAEFEERQKAAERMRSLKKAIHVDTWA